MVGERPLGVTILAILQIITGLLLLLAAASSFAVSSLDVADIEDELGEDVPDYVKDNFDTIFMVTGAVYLLLGLFALAVAYGFLKGIGWAWTIGLILAIVNVISQAITPLLNMSTDALVTAIVGSIIPLIIIFYLTRPRVKAFFGKS